MDFQRNEFELVVKKDGKGAHSALNALLSPAAIAALEAVDHMFEPLKNRKTEYDMEEAAWAKLSPQERNRLRFREDNQSDEERSIAVQKYSTLSNQDILRVKESAKTLPKENFAHLQFEEIDPMAIYLAEEDENSDVISQREREEIIEKKEEMAKSEKEIRREQIIEEIRVGREQEAGILEDRISDIRNRIGLTEDEGGVTEKDASTKIAEMKEDSIRFLKSLDDKEFLLTATDEEIAKHEAAVKEKEAEYAKYAENLFNGAKGSDTQIRIDMDKFVNSKKAENIEIDRSLLRDEIRKFKIKPGAYNRVMERVGGGAVDESFHEREARAYIKLEKAYGQMTPEEREERDRDMAEFQKELYGDSKETVGTKSSFDDRSIPWDEPSRGSSTSSSSTTSSNEATRRSFRSDSTPTESITDTISRSVEIQKKRAEERIEKKRAASEIIEEDNVNTAEAMSQPQERATRKEYASTPEPEKRKGFFSFFSRFRPKKKESIEDRYQEISYESIFGEKKPDNYYEFRASTRVFAERGMIIGGAFEGPLLPPKAEQMREVDRVRGWKRKIKAYVQTRRFRVTVKVAAYCAFTIGIAMMGGEASIENREQYAIAFASMFGGLLLMNSLREDGVDLPAVPFGAPRKGDSSSSRNSSGGGAGRF